MIRLDDFRITYLEEAFECLRAANKIRMRYPEDWSTIPEFWANLMGAVANSNVASANEDVVFGLEEVRKRRQEEADRIKAMLDEKLCPTTG